MQTFLYTLHFIVCFVLIGVVLLQRGKGADLGASLGGGGANTLFGSRGAGNFLSKITTASAIIFMGTSLSLSYLGYQASDVRLFDENADPIELPGTTGLPDAGALEEIPSAIGSTVEDAAEAVEGGLTEVTDALGDSLGAAKSTLSEAGDSISEAASDAAATVEETLQEATTPAE